MVETISPVVHGTRRSYIASATLHVLGATASAALLGAALGGIGALSGAPWRAGALVLALLAALYALREGVGLPIPVPEARRQVPAWWRTFFARPVASLLYGLGLGIGFATHLTFGTFVVVAVGAMLSGDPRLGVAICMPFGLARAVAAVVVGREHRTGNNDALARLEGAATTPAPRVANATMLATVAALALAALL